MRSDYVERVIGRLRGEGLKVTPQRIAVLRCLEGNRSHPSVEEIHRRVSRTFPSISLATVYNTLDTLERIGEVRSVTIDPERRHYDPETRPHHHVMCTACRRIHDVFADFGDVLQLPAELAALYHLDAASVSFHGICRDCSGRTPS